MTTDHESASEPTRPRRSPDVIQIGRLVDDFRIDGRSFAEGLRQAGAALAAWRHRVSTPPLSVRLGTVVGRALGRFARALHSFDEAVKAELKATYGATEPTPPRATAGPQPDNHQHVPTGPS